jgi:hypothetical protein
MLMSSRFVLRMACLAITLASGQTAVHAGVLYSNGQIITHPTGGTGSILGLPISRPDGFNVSTVPGFTFVTSGVGASAPLGGAVAEDFIVPAGGWRLDELTVFAFQSAAPTVTEIRVNLWSAAPFSEFSPDVPPGGVYPTALLSADLAIPAGPATLVGYRQSGTTGTSSASRPIYAYTVSLAGLPNGGFLEAGTYWLEWSFVGANPTATDLTANVYVPLISPRTAVTDRPFNSRIFAQAFTGQPLSWFEGREGYVSASEPGRGYELPFVLTGVPEPGHAFLSAAAGALVLARPRRR